MRALLVPSRVSSWRDLPTFRQRSGRVLLGLTAIHDQEILAVAGSEAEETLRN